MTFKTFTLAATVALAGLPALAQDAGPFTLELNTVADVGNACRLTYVATNETGENLRNASYEVAVFNSDNRVSKLLILEFGALDNHRTRVVQFDIDGQACDDISKILVNNQVDCATSEGMSNSCLERLAARTLETGIVFTD